MDRRRKRTEKSPFSHENVHVWTWPESENDEGEELKCNEKFVDSVEFDNRNDSESEKSEELQDNNEYWNDSNEYWIVKQKVTQNETFPYTACR